MGSAQNATVIVGGVLAGLTRCTAKAAIDSIASARTDKQNIRNINVNDEYHQERDPVAA